MSKPKTDLTGRRFGRWIVVGEAKPKIRFDKNRKRTHRRWNCICDCGKNGVAWHTGLTSKQSNSCGCLRHENVSKWSIKDLTGKRFGRLVVLHETSKRLHGGVIWKAKCDCGTEKNISSRCLLNGDTTSCGCLAKETLSSYSSLTGINHSRWNPKLTDEERNKDRNSASKWRRFKYQIKQRDNFICQICGARGDKLAAHHLKSWRDFPELRFENSNGVTLCDSCHKQVHQIKRIAS